MTLGDRHAVLTALTNELAAQAQMAASRWPTPARSSRGEAQAQLQPLLSSRLTPQTRRAYATDWAAFAAWCAEKGTTVPPAPPELVAVYLAVGASVTQPGTEDPRYRRATLLRWGSSISAIHAGLGYPDPCAQSPAREVLTGIRGLADDRRPARPLLDTDIPRLLAGLPEPGGPREPARRRDRLIVTLGFAAGLGPAELMALSLSNVRIDDRSHALLLSQVPDARAVPATYNPTACATCALASWRELIDLADTSGTGIGQRQATPRTEPGTHVATALTSLSPGRAGLPLLRRIRRGGTITPEPITPQVIRQVLRTLASRAGLPPDTVTGMSLRASHRLDQLLSAAQRTEG